MFLYGQKWIKNLENFIIILHLATGMKTGMKATG